jgi:hypothetical protein
MSHIVTIKGFGFCAWEIDYDKNTIRAALGTDIPFNKISSIELVSDTESFIKNGKIHVCLFSSSSSDWTFEFSHKQKTEINELISVVEKYIPENTRRHNEHQAKESKKLYEQYGIVYHLHGARGRDLVVFDDHVELRVSVTVGSILTGNSTDGVKIIYYKDCIGIQIKPSGYTLGYVQLETASGLMNNKGSNHFNENTFTYDKSNTPEELVNEVVNYIKGKVASTKQLQGQSILQNNQSNNTAETKQSQSVPENNFSVADEILKFKNLLDIGAITEAEYEAQKKQLLNL